jgi:FkbM family methyltransferase
MMLEAVYRAALRRGDVAVDIGANVGRHTLAMSEAVGPEGKVFAYEPLPGVFRELMARIERAEGPSGASNVVARNLALGEEEGQAQFSFVPGEPAYSGFRRRVLPEGLHAETISVPVQRLDNSLAQIDRVKFVKIDAEGGELTILRGGAALISAHAPIISFELGNNSLVNYSYTAADYFDFFDQLDYAIYSIFGIPLDRDELITAAQEQLFWDYVALPRRALWPFGHEQVRVVIRQLGELPSEVREWEARARQAQERAEAAEARIRQAQERAEAAEAHLEALLGSTSWRATAPLRRLAALFLK